MTQTHIEKEGWEDKLREQYLYSDTDPSERNFGGDFQRLIRHVKVFRQEAVLQERARIEEIVESLSVPEIDHDFYDGGDDEYRNRRIAVDSARKSGFVDAKRKILQAINQK